MTEIYGVFLINGITGEETLVTATSDIEQAGQLAYEGNDRLDFGKVDSTVSFRVRTLSPEIPSFVGSIRLPATSITTSFSVISYEAGVDISGNVYCRLVTHHVTDEDEVHLAASSEMLTPQDEFMEVKYSPYISGHIYCESADVQGALLVARERVRFFSTMLKEHYMKVIQELENEINK